MNAGLTREEGLELLRKWNQEPFHCQHALTVEAVMRDFALQMDPEHVDFWGMAGLLHDIDFEKYPEEHCRKCVGILEDAGATPELIHAVCSHGYGACSDVEPDCVMEKVLFAVDELTGLVGAAARMRPSRSCTDMELGSLKKKYKDRKFAAGCSREVIRQGADMLGWELDTLLERTLAAMARTESQVREGMQTLDAGE